MTGRITEAAEREIVMPVPTSEAALQFFTEAMRANTAAMDGVKGEVGELRREVRDVRESVIRIEAINLVSRVERVEVAIDGLVADKDKRDGATSALASLWKNLPSIGAVIVGIVSIAFLILKANGKI